MTKRTWDMLARKWRRALHMFDHVFIHGEDDRQVSADESRCMFERAAGPSELHLVPGMGHFDWVMSGSPGFTRVTGLVLDFLRQHMPV